jgi:hypothetical protein
MINKPNGDGIDHINVYSQGKTLLGRFLSNWTQCDLDMDEDGNFQSVEGYWYWLGTKDDRFRALYGYTAKKLGKEVPKTIHLPTEKFQERIKLAIRRKIVSVGSAYEDFKRSVLPFTHYYVYGGVVKEAGYVWITDFLEELRKEYNAFL